LSEKVDGLILASEQSRQPLFYARAAFQNTWTVYNTKSWLEVAIFMVSLSIYDVLVVKRLDNDDLQL